MVSREFALSHLSLFPPLPYLPSLLFSSPPHPSPLETPKREVSESKNY